MFEESVWLPWLAAAARAGQGGALSGREPAAAPPLLPPAHLRRWRPSSKSTMEVSTAPCSRMKAMTLAWESRGSVRLYQKPPGGSCAPPSQAETAQGSAGAGGQ
jgi:hypothetical protein